MHQKPKFQIQNNLSVEVSSFIFHYLATDDKLALYKGKDIFLPNYHKLLKFIQPIYSLWADSLQENLYIFSISHHAQTILNFCKRLLWSNFSTRKTLPIFHKSLCSNNFKLLIDCFDPLQRPNCNSIHIKLLKSN